MTTRWTLGFAMTVLFLTVTPSPGAALDLAVQVETPSAGRVWYVYAFGASGAVDEGTPGTPYPGVWYFEVCGVVACVQVAEYVLDWLSFSSGLWQRVCPPDCTQGDYDLESYSDELVSRANCGGNKASGAGWGTLIWNSGLASSVAYCDWHFENSDGENMFVPFEEFHEFPCWADPYITTTMDVQVALSLGIPELSIAVEDTTGSGGVPLITGRMIGTDRGTAADCMIGIF